MSRARAEKLLERCRGLATLVAAATTRAGETGEGASWRELAALATAQQTATALQAIAEALTDPDAIR